MSDIIGGGALIPFTIGGEEAESAGTRPRSDVPAHLSSPFTLTAHGAKLVEQRTAEDLVQCAYRVAVFPEGSREDLPEYGVPPLLFATAPVDSALLTEAIARWEPRVGLESREMADGVARARTITVAVS